MPPRWRPWRATKDPAVFPVGGVELLQVHLLHHVQDELGRGPPVQASVDGWRRPCQEARVLGRLRPASRPRTASRCYPRSRPPLVSVLWTLVQRSRWRQLILPLVPYELHLALERKLAASRAFWMNSSDTSSASSTWNSTTASIPSSRFPVRASQQRRRKKPFDV